MALFGSSSSSSSADLSSSSSEDTKKAIMKQIQQEAAVSNARSLVTKINEHCFQRCFPTPGSSVSSKEDACISNCMEKYISMWNTVSKTYTARVVRESRAGGVGGGGGALGLGSLGVPSSSDL